MIDRDGPLALRAVRHPLMVLHGRHCVANDVEVPAHGVAEIGRQRLRGPHCPDDAEDGDERKNHAAGHVPSQRRSDDQPKTCGDGQYL